MPSAEAYLNNGFTRARIRNGSQLFFKDRDWFYELPAGSDIHPIIAGALWIGGMIDGELRLSAARYSGSELWPGPIDDNGSSLANCIDYDHLYKVSNTDINTYESTGIATDDLTTWPTGLGAPTKDADGIVIDISQLSFNERFDRVIDLRNGERPAIKGHQSIWWVMNDLGNVHIETGSQPLAIEVHAMSYSVVTGSDAIDYTTFYEYRIINKNPLPLSDAYVGFYLDPDLGDFDDDLFGSDSARGLGFLYNADNNDGGENGYGSSPPAIGALFVEGPVAPLDGRDNDRDGQIDEVGERLSTSTVGRFENGGGLTETPTEAMHYYNYMRARWKDGKPFTIGGIGRDCSDRPTNYLFPGDPVTGVFWSEINNCESPIAVEPGERHFFLASGPFSLEPGEGTDFTLAIVWARGDDHLNSITELRSATDLVRFIHSTGYFSNPRAISENPAFPAPNVSAALADNYPEPFSEKTTIRYRVPDFANVQLVVLDVLGREVTLLVREPKDAGEYSATFDGTDLPSGVYFYRIEIGHASATRSMMLVK